MNPEFDSAKSCCLERQKEVEAPKNSVRRLLVTVFLFCLGETTLRISALIINSDRAESGDIALKVLSLVLAIGGLLLVVVPSVIVVAWIAKVITRSTMIALKTTLRFFQN